MRPTETDKRITPLSQKPPGTVEDFTDAFLVSAGMLLFCGLFALAALTGFFWALLAAACMNRAIGHIGRVA